MAMRDCLCDLADHEMAIDSPTVRQRRERREEEKQQRHCGLLLHPEDGDEGEHRHGPE